MGLPLPGGGLRNSEEGGSACVGGGGPLTRTLAGHRPQDRSLGASSARNPTRRRARRVSWRAALRPSRLPFIWVSATFHRAVGASGPFLLSPCFGPFSELLRLLQLRRFEPRSPASELQHPPRQIARFGPDPQGHLHDHDTRSAAARAKGVLAGTSARRIARRRGSEGSVLRPVTARTPFGRVAARDDAPPTPQLACSTEPPLATRLPLTVEGGTETDPTFAFHGKARETLTQRKCRPPRGSDNLPRP
jgi:hypothetical protein